MSQPKSNLNKTGHHNEVSRRDFFNGLVQVSCAGGQFVLTYDSPGPGQPEWRFCSKCFALFFNGFPNKGVCAAGGAHFAEGFNFTLLHDTRAANHQQNWRFCKNCEVLFYDGDSNKGVCRAGGGHVAAGYKFILRFRGNLEGDVQQNPVSP